MAGRRLYDMLMHYEHEESPQCCQSDIRSFCQVNKPPHEICMTGYPPSSSSARGSCYEQTHWQKSRKREEGKDSLSTVLIPNICVISRWMTRIFDKTSALNKQHDSWSKRPSNEWSGTTELKNIYFKTRAGSERKDGTF